MKDHNLTRLISSATRLNNSSQFWKTLNRYLLIGFSTLLLIYIGGVGRVDITNNTVLADFDPRCGQDGSKCHDSAGCVGNISVWGTWDEDGNLIKEIERVGEVPGQCGNPPASSGAACEQNSGLCGENTTFCENTGMGSLKMFKHGGVCNPSHGEAD
ncbi:hypothetical protein HYW43_03725, partial [Candidatus Daviesbacteria bacterium]|nr:hypothetical protein [Candidatus Daviesbacteria bacterium]